MRKSTVSHLIRGLVVVIASVGICLQGFSAVYAQSFWEKRQKRLQEMKKNKYKKTPQDKTIVTPDTKTIPQDQKELMPYQPFQPYEAEEDEFELPPLETFEPRVELGLKRFGKILGKGEHIDPETIAIPEEYGTIKEIRHRGNNSKLIIHIQDAHVNYDAQISMAYIIESLLIDYGINTALLEGGLKEDVGVGEFKWTGFRQARIKVAQKYLKAGRFMGAEYLDAISPYPLNLRGLEDPKLYYESDDLQLKILDLKSDVKKKIADIRKSALHLKVGVYSKALHEFDKKKEAYNKEEISLADYSTFLEKRAKKMNIRKKAPSFYTLLQTIHLEKEIDFPGVDDERTRLIDELSEGAGKEKSDELVQRSLDFRQGKINAVAFYAYLADQYKGDLEKKYPHLEKYTRYITLHKKIDTHALFSEMDDLEWIIRAKYYENKDQKTLDTLTRNLKILEGLFGLELTPDEYAYYRAHDKEFRNVKQWVIELNKIATKLNLTRQFDTNVRSITSRIPTLDRFYANTYARDDAFLKKAEETFSKTGKEVIMLVAGGFHSPNLVRLFNENNYSYMVIAPKITNPTPPGLYDKVIREGIMNRKKQRK